MANLAARSTFVSLGSSNARIALPITSPTLRRASSVASLNSFCNLAMFEFSMFSRLSSKLPSSAATCGHGWTGGASNQKYYKKRNMVAIKQRAHQTNFYVGNCLLRRLLHDRPGKVNAKVLRGKLKHDGLGTIVTR